jgi:hypothetical protein
MVVPDEQDSDVPEGVRARAMTSSEGGLEAPPL